MKYFFLLLFSLAFTGALKAQSRWSRLSVGGGFNYTFDDNSSKVTGTHLVVSYDADPGSGFSLSYTGCKTRGDKDLPVKYSVFAFNFYYRLIGDYDDRFSLYVPMSAALVTAAAGDIAGLPEEFQLGKKTGIYMMAGLGMHYHFGSFLLFTQGQLAFPIKVLDQSRGDLPYMFPINSGIKIPFGKIHFVSKK